MDSAEKQYWIFSLIVASIISFFLNFIFVNLLNTGFFYGFPFGLRNLTGFAFFLNQTLNFLVNSAILTIAIYFFFKWLRERGSGGSDY